MSFVVCVIFGALAGWIASMVLGKNKQMGAITNIVVGIIGAFLGGVDYELFRRAGSDRLQHSQPAGRDCRSRDPALCGGLVPSLSCA